MPVRHTQPKLVPEMRLDVKPGFILMPVKKDNRVVHIQVPKTMIENPQALKTYIDAELKKLNE